MGVGVIHEGQTITIGPDALKVELYKKGQDLQQDEELEKSSCWSKIRNLKGWTIALGPKAWKIKLKQDEELEKLN